jgi:hypothetical protein
VEAVKPIDPQAALEQMWKLAPQYAQAKAERVYLEEYRKTLKATLMKGCGLDAIGAQEREAYAHEDYATHLQGLRAAVEAEEALRWRLVAAQAAIEVWRSTEASNRNMDKAAR